MRAEGIVAILPVDQVARKTQWLYARILNSYCQDIVEVCALVLATPLVSDVCQAASELVP
jgi:hypothetical protein